MRTFTRKLKGGNRKGSNKSEKSSSLNKYEKLVVRLLSALDSIKLFHWITKNYNTHKITDELYGELQDKTDSLIENIIGMKNGAGHSNSISIHHIHNIPIKATSNEQIKRMLIDLKSYLVKEITSKEGVATEAIRDELVVAINKYLYLEHMK